MNVNFAIPPALRSAAGSRPSCSQSSAAAFEDLIFQVRFAAFRRRLCFFQACFAFLLGSHTRFCVALVSPRGPGGDLRQLRELRDVAGVGDEAAWEAKARASRRTEHRRHEARAGGADGQHHVPGAHEAAPPVAPLPARSLCHCWCMPADAVLVSDHCLAGPALGAARRIGARLAAAARRIESLWLLLVLLILKHQKQKLN